MCADFNTQYDVQIVHLYDMKQKKKTNQLPPCENKSDTTVKTSWLGYPQSKEKTFY